jgi:hypothetical protein
VMFGFASGWHASAAEVCGAPELRKCRQRWWWKRDGESGCRFFVGDLQGL